MGRPNKLTGWESVETPCFAGPLGIPVCELCARFSGHGGLGSGYGAPTPWVMRPPLPDRHREFTEEIGVIRHRFISV